MVINGPKKFCRINGVAVLTRVFFTRKCMVVFARLPKKSGYNNEVAWLYYQGGRKAGFHCTKFKKLRKVYNLPFFSVLGHFFYPKFPLSSFTKIPSMFLFSASIYLKEIKTKKMSNIYIKIIIHVLHVYVYYCNSLVLKKLESLKWGSFLVLHYKDKKWRLLLSLNTALIQVLEAQYRIKVQQYKNTVKSSSWSPYGICKNWKYH